MADELLQPGVSVIQEIRTISPTIITPTLVPCAIAPAFQVLEVLETDATGNRTVNVDTSVSAPAVITASLPGLYSGLNTLTLKVNVNNGATQMFTFSDSTSVGLSALQAKDRITASVPAPVGFGAYVVTKGSSSYLQLRSTAKGEGQYLKVLDGTANTLLGFNTNYQSEGISTYKQYDVHVEQLNFPDPKNIANEVDVDESSIRVFSSIGGTSLKEFSRSESFLRKHKGATYTSGTLSFGSGNFISKKFAFKFKKADTTHEFTFVSEPADLAALVTAMSTLCTALTGLTFVANGTYLDVKSTFGYFEVVTPSSVSCHTNLGWTDGAKAYTVEPVNDGDGDTLTPFMVVDQEDFSAIADGATLTGTGSLAAPVQVHNKTFFVFRDGKSLQEVLFDAGPIIGTSVFNTSNTLKDNILNFTVNGTGKTVTFTGTDPISMASIISQINVAAGITVVYQSLVTGVPSPTGTYLSFQVGGSTKVDGGEVVLLVSSSTGTLIDLGFLAADIYQTMTDTEIENAINATMGSGFATTPGNYLVLTSTITGDESKITIGNGTANTILGFTNGQSDNGAPFAPKVGDAIYVDGILIGYVSIVMPGGYTKRLKLDREISTTFGGYAMYIQALNIPSSLPADRPSPDLVIDLAGAVDIKQDVLRDIEGNAIVAQGTLFIAYKALRLDVTPRAITPGLLNIEDTSQLATALPPVNTDNPLSLMLYFMSINAPSILVTGIGVDAISSSNPDGTPEAYSRALTFLEAQEVYALAPASQDPIVHQLFQTHVDFMSEPDSKGERIVFICPRMPGESIPVMVSSGTDGDSTGVTNEFNTKLPNLSLDILNAGLDPTNLPANAGLYLDIATDTKKYNVSAVSGMKLTVRIAFAPGENDDGFYSTTNLPSDLISESYTLYARGLPLVTTDGDPDYNNIAQAYQDLGKSYGNRRVYMVAPELVGANIDSTEQSIPGYYLCSAIAGMCGQQPPQQGFTNFPIAGFTRPFGSNDVFSGRQMNRGAAGGTYWVVQETAGGALTTRFQLSTNLTSVETRELSITKIVDFCAKFQRSGLRNFIGKFNITQPFLDTLSSVVQGQLKYLEENDVIVGGELNNIVQDKDSPDTVFLDEILDIPYPCNYIRLTIVI